MKRRHLLAALPILAAPSVLRAQGGPIRVTDVTGRQVTLPRLPKRIVLVQARHVLAMALLHPDPVSLVVGWGDDLRRMNPPDYATVRARFPAADAVPVVGRAQGDGLSLENVLAARPDLVILSRAGARGGTNEMADRIAALGVPAITIDFFADPMRDTRPSMAVLGQVLGQEEKAKAFDALYAGRLERISQRLAGLGAAERPKVMVHAHAGGTPCCSSPGHGAFDGMVSFAGGRNIGAEMIPGSTGQLALEYVLTQAPDVYVATGGPYGGRGGIPLGPGVDEAEARKALVEVIRRSRMESLAAVRGGRAHAIWHGFNDTPAHVVMLEALARWFQPARCGDLDPAATVAELNARFLSIPMEGAHWVSLPPGAL
ncbi:ABC transporter substrate-binding protein [Roseomonas populi]|uniref:ABC transporter substrate-binding protein n=1 Tax=Roseomonas populi TaxID=3121582 RepID=A0ABT1X624_9PROT|nr:ABC transporter substrate-binding protein [Roseomonas pecuniae]MCR0983221.1 ABC transporter substrate-binding protein [Roseomonas pecuniae]